MCQDGNSSLTSIDLLRWRPFTKTVAAPLSGGRNLNIYLTRIVLLISLWFFHLSWCFIFVKTRQTRQNYSGSNVKMFADFCLFVISCLWFCVFAFLYSFFFLARRMTGKTARIENCFWFGFNQYLYRVFQKEWQK